MTDLRDALGTFDDALTAADAVAAIAVVDDLLAAGVPPITVLTEVVATAQRTVGGRWERAEWTVAAEHAATAVAVAATEAVAEHTRRTAVTRGKVLVACAEREWHALPAMIIDCVLRAEGWDTTLLGASTSPLRLSQYLNDLGPDAVAVSCSVLGALPATRRFIEASTGAGIPIVVGGAAFGPDDVRARALGATAWAADAHSAVRVVADLPAVVPPAAPLPAAPAAEQAALELAHRQLVAELRESWSVAAMVSSTDPDAIQEAAVDALPQVLHAVSAALLTGDVRTLPESAEWIGAVLRARGGDESLVGELGELLTAALRDYPLAGDLVERHWPRVAGRPTGQPLSLPRTGGD